MAISGWGVFLIILVLLVIGGAGGYIGYTRWRANRLGLPPPPLNPFAKTRDDATYRAPAPRAGGVVGWVTDKFTAARNKRTAGGAYESTSYGGGGAGESTRGARRGFGPLDPDEAWDARVDHEASGYYEEQELGLHDPAPGPYGGHGYAENNIGVGGVEAGRGRSKSRQRELDDRYDEEVHGGSARLNPFGDAAEPSNISMRSMSPRPDADPSSPGAGGASKGAAAHKKKGSADDSPTERRKIEDNYNVSEVLALHTIRLAVDLLDMAKEIGLSLPLSPEVSHLTTRAPRPSIDFDEILAFWPATKNVRKTLFAKNLQRGMEWMKTEENFKNGVYRLAVTLQAVDDDGNAIAAWSLLTPTRMQADGLPVLNYVDAEDAVSEREEEVSRHLFLYTHNPTLDTRNTILYTQELKSIIRNVAIFFFIRSHDTLCLWMCPYNGACRWYDVVSRCRFRFRISESIAGR
ncbi:hypothetical protein BST61_g1444 [Cercospora zeina]